MHVPGTRVPRRLGVARSASSPKAAQALGCSLTPGLRISFGRVTCMARAASVPGLWALGFLLLCGVCVWVRLAVGCGFCQPRLSWLGFRVGVFGLDLWCSCVLVSAICGVRGLASVSVCFWDVCGFVGAPLAPRRFRFRRAVWACVPGPGLACAQSVWVGLSGCVFFFFLLWFFLFFFFFFFGALWSLSLHPLSFGLGWWLSFFFFFSVPFPRGPLLLAWCCWFWVGGSPVPLRGSPLFFFFFFWGGGPGRLWWCWRVVGRLWAVFVPFPLPPSFFFFFFLGGGLACSSLCLPWAGARTGLYSVLSSGLLFSVGFCVAMFRPHGSGGLCTLWARRPFLLG